MSGEYKKKRKNTKNIDIKICLKKKNKTLHEKAYFFSKCSEKMVFPKKIPLENYISCIIRKGDISLSQKHDLVLQTENER